MNQRLIIFLLSLLTIVSVTYSDDSPQQHNCTELVAQGKCLSDTPFMQQHCQDDCYKWKQDIEKIRVEYIDEDEPSFYDLRAKNSTGHTIPFGRFEGIITIVTVLRKVCGQKDATEAIYRSMETLHDTWPYGLEIIFILNILELIILCMIVRILMQSIKIHERNFIRWKSQRLMVQIPIPSSST